MRLYLDDDSVARALSALLRRVGHQVILPAQVAMSGKEDPIHLLYALQQSLILLTRNHNDFSDLHELVIGAGGAHSGILTVRFDNDRQRDMKPPDIVRAIARLIASGAPLASQLVVLNHWR